MNRWVSFLLFPTLVLLVGLLSAACKRSEQASWCQASEGTCSCQNHPFTEGSGAPVPNCDAPPTGVVWVCGVETQANGQAISCSCGVYSCVTGTTYEAPAVSYCLCEVGAARYFVDGGASVGSCDTTVTGGGACCVAEDTVGSYLENGCGCTSTGDEIAGIGRAACGVYGATPATDCSSSAPSFIPNLPPYGDFATSSCADLSWAPPPPDAGSSSGYDDGEDCPGGCGGCSRCAAGECISCPIGDLGICTC